MDICKSGKIIIMSEKITLPTGAKLEISLLAFEDAWSVVQTITKVLEGIHIDLKEVDFANIVATDVFNLKAPICAILSNKEIIDAAKICFKRTLYNGIKIDGQTFETKDSRKDFLPVVYHVIKENISPFFANLLSLLGTK